MSTYVSGGLVCLLDAAFPRETTPFVLALGVGLHSPGCCRGSRCAKRSRSVIYALGGVFALLGGSCRGGWSVWGVCGGIPRAVEKIDFRSFFCFRIRRKTTFV